MRHYLPLFLVIGLAACTEQPADDPMYETAKADRRTIEVSVSSSGIVEPLATVEVKSKASGEVLDVMVEVGDHVERDTLLVRIDPRTVRNDLAPRASGSSRRRHSSFDAGEGGKGQGRVAIETFSGSVTIEPRD